MQTFVMAQLTLVAFYGPKPVPLARLVAAIHTEIAASPLAPYFRPYTVAQIHATIVGLERAEYHGLKNANFAAIRGEQAVMNLERALALARAWPALTIRFGGFKPEDRQLTSQGHSPYVRSFQLRLRQQKVVLIGWSHQAGNFERHTMLWALRRHFGQAANVWPKYDNDSDLFLALGELAIPEEEARATGNACIRLEATVRDQLSGAPIDVPLTAADLAFVCYTTPTLDPASSKAWRVLDPHLSAALLAGAYEAC
jgi:hypothetical protein